MDGAWVEYDLGPTTIGVGCHPAWQPSRDGTTVAFEVDDIDATIEKLKERGVTFDMRQNRNAGLLDGTVSRSRREQACCPQEKELIEEIRNL